MHLDSSQFEDEHCEMGYSFQLLFLILVKSQFESLR
jgi:hypothetical protein